jgi:hypothetical protein
MDTPESSARHAHPSTEDHDDTVEAHYSGLERLRPHGCYDGLVYIGHLAVDPETGDEVEIVGAIRCMRCVVNIRGVWATTGLARPSLPPSAPSVSRTVPSAARSILPPKHKQGMHSMSTRLGLSW